jgi:hypothetical protein
MKKKVFIIKSGKFKEGVCDTLKVFADEGAALRYAFRYYGIRNWLRDNPLKIKGLRWRRLGRDRWVTLTEHKLLGTKT